MPRRLLETPAEPAAEAERRSTRRRTVAARGAHRVITVLALVGSLHALFLLGVETWRFVVEQRAVAQLQRQVTDLKQQSGELQQVIGHAGDQRYREDLARRQGYMYPKEQRAVTQQPSPPAAGPAGTATGP